MRALRFRRLIFAIIILLVLFQLSAVFAQVDIFSLGNYFFGGGKSEGDNYSLIGLFPFIHSNTSPSGGGFELSNDVHSPIMYDSVYVNTAWLNTAPGSDLGNNRRFFSNAFADIQIAHDHVAEKGSVEVFSGSYDSFHLNRSVMVNIQGDISIDGDLKLSTGLLNAPHGILNLTGSFINQGNHFSANDGTVKFSGSGEKYISLESPTQFSNLSIEAGVTLVENNPVNHGSISQTYSNHGTIRKTLTITGPGEYIFGLTGAAVSILESGGAHQVQIDQVGQNHSQMEKLSSGNLALPLHYRLTSSGGQAKANLCLDYSQSQVPSTSLNQESSLRLCNWDSSKWNCFPRGGNSDTASNTVCAENVPLLYDWIIVPSDSIPQNTFYFPLVSN